MTRQCGGSEPRVIVALWSADCPGRGSGRCSAFTVAGMDVSEIIGRPRDFVGRDTSVRGRLLIGADSRLVADENRPDELAILLPHPATRDRLLSAVPPYGGGRYIYAEDATVVGTLSDQPLRFATVRQLIIRRDRNQVWDFAGVS